MGNMFYGKGNLADSPELKKVRGQGGKADFDVAKMRVFFDRYGEDAQGNLVQTGGFWREVEIYGNKAKACSEHLRKGARVAVMGEVRDFQAHDESGKEVTAVKVVAEDVTLVLTRIEKVVFKASRAEREETAVPA